MSQYTFTFKKDDIYVEFTTEDRNVVERQFQIWVLHADEYARNNAVTDVRSKPAYTPQPQPLKSAESPKPEPVVAPVQVQEIPPVQMTIPQPAPQPVQPEPQPQSTPLRESNNYDMQQAVVQQQQLQNNSAFDTASDLLKTINSVKGEKEYAAQQVAASHDVPQVERTEVPAQTTVEVPQQNIQASVENIPQQTPRPEAPVETEVAAPQAGTANVNMNFESVLDEKIESDTVYEPPKNVDQIFLNLINSKNTKDKFHYLMITAYYLTEFGRQERFTLKQINSKLMQNVAEVIDHTMIQEAIDKGYIELVPDAIGLSGIGEYRLTRQGEEFFSYKI